MRKLGPLKIVGALALGGLAIATGPFFSAIGAPGTAPATPSRFQLSLAGQHAGYVQSYSGGESDVVSPANATLYAKKPLGTSVIKPLVMQANAGMSKSFFTALRGMLDGSATHYDGSVIAYNHDMAPLFEVDFHQAVVSEIDFPALDATSTNPTYLTASLAPETVARTTMSGPAQTFVAPSPQAMFLAKNFRLNIDGVSCQRVAKVSSISTASSSFTIEFSALDRASFDGWFKAGTARVVKVEGSLGAVRNGTLAYMSPDLKTELLDLSLTGLRVTSVSPVSSDTKATATITFQHVTISGGTVLN